MFLGFVLQELVDDDRADHVWARYSKLLYPRGQKAVLDGEDLDVGGNIVRLGGKRYFLQVLLHVTRRYHILTDMLL